MVRSGPHHKNNNSQPVGGLVRMALHFSHILSVRHRYILTRHNRLRLRYSIFPAMLAAAFAGLISFLPFERSTRDAHASVSPSLMAEAMNLASIVPAAGNNDISNHDSVRDMGENNETNVVLKRYEMRKKRLSRYVSPDEAGQKPQVRPVSYIPKIKEEEFTVGKGDTLSAVLAKAGLNNREAYLATQALAEDLDPRYIRVGQKFSMIYSSDDNGQDYRFKEMRLAVDPLKTVSLSRNAIGEFKSEIIRRETVLRTYAQEAEIEVSLYGSAAKAGIPAAVIADAIRIYSWDVDFQRDIRQGDKISVLYERHETKDGIHIKSGNILYASLMVNGHEIPIYRYETKDGDIDYFKPDGTSVRKALMKTPIEGARLSSGFGMRHHPVLGYDKMHKGVDFAAPRGTPIYAAGDGVIERASRHGGYGNYIRIRHNSSLKTAYAHLNGYAKGISAGVRVKQGQVIGYVGTTGRSTGPHLHYEVLKNGAQTNPSRLKLPQGEALKGGELASFETYTEKLDSQYIAVLQKTAVKNDYASLRQ